VARQSTKVVRRQPSSDRSRNEARDFLIFVDEQITIAKNDLERAREKLTILEELKRTFSSKPPVQEKGLERPQRQSAATHVIASYLMNRTEPVPTIELLRLLERQGLKFGGHYPRNTLSVLLSRSKHFRAHGRRGWTLVRAQ
jgi:hypothetical protein